MGAIVTLYCNMVSCPHNNGDSAGGCCTIPAGMLVNANGECDQAVIVKRARKIPCCGTQPTSANTGYTAVLESEMKQFFDKKDFPISNYNIRQLAAHLNTALQNQHCA